MSQDEIRHLYHSFKENGDLTELFPTLSGVWEVDKEEFKTLYMFNEQSLDSLDDDIFFDEDYY